MASAAVSTRRAEARVHPGDGQFGRPIGSCLDKLTRHTASFVPCWVNHHAINRPTIGTSRPGDEPRPLFGFGMRIGHTRLAHCHDRQFNNSGRALSTTS